MAKFLNTSLALSIALALLASVSAKEIAYPGVRESAETNASISVTEVLFEESEPGIEPYRTRMLVSKDYLRIDDVQNEGDYILYDRIGKKIFSVIQSNRSILKIRHRLIQIDPPYPLKYETQKEKDPQAPKISGKPLEYLVFKVNDRECYRGITVAGLLNRVTEAMKEYAQTLAGEQALNLAKTPPEMQTPCMLANMIFAPSRHLEYGFPIRQWDYRGKARALVDYHEAVDVDHALFQIPEDYRVFSLQE